MTRRLKDVEISFPIVYGTIAFWLGKKASEYNSHKWTVYVRGTTNEDLGVIVKRAVFQLHPSFNNPTRVVESAPFELSESGWGEFEIAIRLFFHSDVCDKQLDLYHQLKLFPEDENGPQSTKKPVVVEMYDEIVFFEPTEALFARVQNHPAAIVPRLSSGLNLPPPGPFNHVNEMKRGDTKDHPLSQWFMNFSEADELLKLAAARQHINTERIYVSKIPLQTIGLKRRKRKSLGTGPHRKAQETVEHDRWPASLVKSCLRTIDLFHHALQLDVAWKEILQQALKNCLV
ncbi:hypothetical protein OPV22_001502 [Ensete ventricosum]|uniref:YEATS domain-containing protein n=1 Tax=Ensete ventricosum TaxID=4639 RepID=A0AAV8RTK3_ENSVE|nr:hypothetical protein OPV22_001502 [Ensete ventricosum]